MAFDLAIVETGNGGDIQLMGNDLAVVNDIENMPYLAMFGGNKESTIAPSSIISQPLMSFDFWGNNLLMPDQSQQFNSLCERALNENPLTSSGRVLIENSIIKDLQFLQPQAKVTVSVTIVSHDKVNIDIIIKAQRIQVVTIKFKKAVSGDFSPLDFNSDFLIS